MLFEHAPIVELTVLQRCRNGTVLEFRVAPVRVAECGLHVFDRTVYTADAAAELRVVSAVVDGGFTSEDAVVSVVVPAARTEVETLSSIQPQSELGVGHSRLCIGNLDASGRIISGTLRTAVPEHPPSLVSIVERCASTCSI